MEPGTSYETELRLSVRKPGSRRVPPPAIRVRFTGTATAPMTSGQRTLDLRQFKPGSYWLDLIVTDARGHDAQRRIWFDVRALRTAQ